ncbi:MAG TPA: sigma-E factor negative regulatory protein, partial [Usitatibacter sp.]|nr:sigma-E factor negative regulatory protein [Usitatibacter sp.]
MTQEISSLMDGELESHEAERAIRGCCADSEAARKWQEYHLISDVLRGGRPHPSGTAERVRRLLESEPAIVARPRRVLDTTFGRLALAAAASVATIGVVGWIGSQGGQPVPGAVIAKNPAAAPAVQPVVNRIEPAPDVQEYLTAHRQIPSAELYRTVTNRAPA